MKRDRKVPIAAVVLLGLAGCSGGRTFTPPMPAATATASNPTGSGRSGATLTIVVPHPSSATAGARRRPQYVSPSSTTLSVAVNGGSASSYGLTASSPGCTTQDANLTCTFSIVAPPGHDTLALALADGSGRILSHNIVTVTVASGVSTPVAVTLAGVPASVAIVPGANAFVDTAVAPYHAPGLNPQPIEVEALDADGNVIVGPGAPSVGSVNVTSGTAYASVASAQTTDPAAFFLTPSGGSAGGKTVTIGATVRGIPLADGTLSTPITSTTTYLFTPAVAIGSAHSATLYSVETGQAVAQVPACAGACATTIVNDLATDTDGNMYLSYNSFLGISGGSTIAVIPHGAPAPAYGLGSTQQVHSLGGVAVDTHNILYAANGNTGTFGHARMPPAITEYAFGAVAPLYTIAGTPAQPSGIAVDPSGNIFVSDPFGSVAVLEYPPKSQTSSATLSDPSIAEPTSMVTDVRGGLYVTDQTNNDIAFFGAKQTALTSTLSDSSFGGGIDYLMMDPSGNLWVSLGPTNSVERLDGASLPNNVVVTETLPRAARWVGFPNGYSVTNW